MPNDLYRLLPSKHPTPLNEPSAPRTIAIIGGGVTGLSAALRVRELAPESQVTVFEADVRCGGVLATERHGDYLVERSADMFTTREPWALELCKRLGLADELLPTDARYRRAFVARKGKLHPIPEGFTLLVPSKMWPIAASPLLSVAGKARMLREYFVPPRKEGEDESLASFAIRRLGREAFERLIQPLVGGIYTADPAKLSMAAALPQFLEMERKHGSLLAAMFGAKKPEKTATSDGGARYSQFLAPRRGMSQLIEAMVSALPRAAIRTSTPIERIERQASGDWLVTPRGEAPQSFDDLIFTLPARHHALLAGIDASLADLVSRIPYSGCSVVVFGVERKKIAHRLDGTGFVVPAIEKRKIIAASFSSVKFAHRAPEDRVLIRTFIGGALQPELAELPEDELLAIARKELADYIGLSGEPELSLVVRWLGAMPQYHVGHVALADQIAARAAEIPHFALAGNAYRGVGIPFCVKSGETAAEKLLGRFAAT